MQAAAPAARYCRQNQTMQQCLPPCLWWLQKLQAQQYAISLIFGQQTAAVYRPFFAAASGRKRGLRSRSAA